MLVALQSKRVGWNGPDVLFVYCIRHIASNFNKQFKNVDLKKQVINMGMFLPISCFITCSLNLLLIVLSFRTGYEMRKPRFEAKLLAMRAEFPQAALVGSNF